MRLQLQYNPAIYLPVSAAFIRTADVFAWLKEMAQWKIPVDDMEWYVLSASAQSLDAGGLFVVFKHPEKIKQDDLFEPYCAIEGKLFIPLHTSLVPEVSKEEWKKLLIWHVQLFHPVFGFVGFEQKDQLDPLSLFKTEPALDVDWSFANPGLAANPAFQKISVQRQSTEEVMDSLKEEVGQKPLGEIPASKEGNPSFLQKMMDRVLLGILKVLAFIFRGLVKVMPAGSEKTTTSAQARAGGFQKVQKWLEENMEELQRRRDTEIKRLLNLFDENSREALQYAIPLDSPYFDRGKQTGNRSFSLMRNPLKFNLGKLGGGSLVDSWDVGNYYNDLRTKYLQSAQKEIERKDFRRAAYVYAHLLGDYSSAANCLEQGGMYREAAVLYKDHLKNIPAAAECLERGGLYAEAIELYEDLNRFEKIGDLYVQLGQKGNADIYYDKQVGAKIKTNDHLDAARILNEKMKETERARQTLLTGWNTVFQPEPCLKKYFDLLGKENEPIDKHVKEIYLHQTPKHKKLPFLNVLEDVHRKNEDTAAGAALQEIAFEILNEEADNGNLGVLGALSRFFPEDKLVSSDSSRYRTGGTDKPKAFDKKNFFYLDQGIKWINGVWHRNQFLILGLKDGYLHLARANSDGNIEYYTWEHQVPRNTSFSFISHPYLHNSIMLNASEGIPAARKSLPRTKYFNEYLVVQGPVWMHKQAPHYAFTDPQHITRLESSHSSMSLHQYTMEGKLKETTTCETGGFLRPDSRVVFHDDIYYTFFDKEFVEITKKGKVTAHYVRSGIRFLATSQYFPDFSAVVSTNRGCSLFEKVDGELREVAEEFAADLIPIHIVFIASKRFIMAEKQKAYLFEISGNKPVRVAEYEAGSRIIAIMPASDRNQFVMIEETGKITLCHIETR